jgi:acyl-CoA thioesterase
MNVHTECTSCDHTMYVHTECTICDHIVYEHTDVFYVIT